jgi:hypothetical protein
MSANRYSGPQRLHVGLGTGVVVSDTTDSRRTLLGVLRLLRLVDETGYDAARKKSEKILDWSGRDGDALIVQVEGWIKYGLPSRYTFEHVRDQSTRVGRYVLARATDDDGELKYVHNLWTPPRPARARCAFCRRMVGKNVRACAPCDRRLRRDATAILRQLPSSQSVVDEPATSRPESDVGAPNAAAAASVQHLRNASDPEKLLVHDVAVRRLTMDAETEMIVYALKCIVSLDAGERRFVHIMLQALDPNGFEVAECTLSGWVSPAPKTSLTGRTEVSRHLEADIAEWKFKCWWRS